MSRLVLVGLAFMVMIIATSVMALFVVGKFLGNRNLTGSLFPGKRPLIKGSLPRAEAQEQQLGGVLGATSLLLEPDWGGGSLFSGSVLRDCADPGTGCLSSTETKTCTGGLCLLPSVSGRQHHLAVTCGTQQ